MSSSCAHQPLCLWTVWVWRIQKCDSWADKADGNHAGCPTQSYTEHRSLNSLTNMETVGSFHDMVLFLSSTRVSLPSSQCSSIQRGPPTRSGKNRVQHIQSGGATSPHSSLRRVSVCSHSCCLFFFLRHFFLLGLWSPSLSCDGKSCVSGNHSESAERCMPATSRGTTHSLTSSACWINPQACSETCAYCTNSWEIWPCTSVSLRMAVLMVEWEALYVYLSWVFRKKERKKAPEATLSDPPWLSDLETSQAELWILSSQIWFAVILSFFFFYMMGVFLTASKWTARSLDGWEFTLRCILSSSVTLSGLLVVWKTQYPPPPPQKKSNTLYLYMFATRQTK